MKKSISSVEYAELSGLGIALLSLSQKENKTDQEVIVENWITQRMAQLKIETSN
ncbi:uncharacterized protein METZ01_LOCUS174024 [marine metagenome]|uniref:Uncharacterized protein n=1 Tax=marine metagenome TaxID=408172 RepID=A0A382C551_9ZZZZ|tara:strand:+ start:1283 stop:1444 length:162 start_codon:yes stop_codon:yes gene_type:complete